MRNIRIYQAGEYSPGREFLLTEDAAHHLAAVLRMQPGDCITLFRGDNCEYQALIKNIQKKKVTVEILTEEKINRESPLSLHLAQAISKGDRMEWIVQKSIELGVHSITPVITAHCAVKLQKEKLEKKIRQWQGVAIAACEQSGRTRLPVIFPILSLEKYLSQNLPEMKIILDPLANQSWPNSNFHSDDLALLVGPEGGLSVQEILLAKEAGFTALRMGPRILRTETAAIAAISILQALHGDL